MLEAIGNWILRRIEREGEVIHRAPLAFGLALGFGIALASIGIWFAMWWHYDGTISALRATIETLQTGNSQLQTENARLKDDLSGTKQGAGNVQGQQAPRRIVKREEFLRALREAGPATLNMNYIAGDGDAAGLFSDLHDLLFAGGWKIKDKANVSGSAWIGVRVIVKDRNVPPPGAVLLVELLMQNGIVAFLVGHPTHVALTSDIFSVDIGFRHQ